MIKRLFLLLTAFMLCAALCGCAVSAEPAADPAPEETAAPAETPAGTATPADTAVREPVYATITVRDFGVIECALYPDIAPETVYNFVYLARQGYYDGLIFHRVVKDFMIQGGDPLGTGRGGPGYCIRGEFSANGFENDLLHERGVISMSRKGGISDSAGSQFFIVHADNPSLNGQYAAFGKVTAGMDVVDAIAGVRVNNLTKKPYDDVVIESITIDGPELPEPNKLPEV